MLFSFKSIDWFIKLIGFSLLLLLLACEPQRLPYSEISGGTMGTSYSIKVIADRIDVTATTQAVSDRLAEINQVFSTYIPGSELSLLNSNPSSGPIPVSEELMSILKLCGELHALTDGALDVTVGPLVNLWGFGPGGPANGMPSNEAIDEAMQRTGFDRITFLESAIARPAGLYIDLSAVAKGYGVDEIARLLEARDIHRYMVEIGGEVRARGTNQRGQPWQIGVETPDRHTRKLQKVMPLRDRGMATSGDYRNYFEHEGVNYSHTIDPDTGWPVSHNMASVTVLHPQTAWADGIATGFSVLGEARTMAIAEEQKLAVLAIIRDSGDYREVISSTMQAYLAEHD